MRNCDKSSFESDMKSAVYNAISDVCFDYSDCDFSKEEIMSAVDYAVDWWYIKFFDKF